MSNQEESELSAKVDRLIKLGPWIKALLVGAFAIGGWAATLEWRVQQTAKTAHEVDEIKLWVATTDGSRFTSQQGHEMAAGLAEKITINDKRIQRTEDAILVIKDSLVRIERKLDDAQ